MTTQIVWKDKPYMGLETVVQTCCNCDCHIGMTVYTQGKDAEPTKKAYDPVHILMLQKRVTKLIRQYGVDVNEQA